MRDDARNVTTIMTVEKTRALGKMSKFVGPRPVVQKLINSELINF